MDGWVKNYRKQLESGIMKNHKLFTFWQYCLLKASHKPHSQIVGNQEIELKPGQFVTGLFVISSDLNLTIQNVRTLQKTLSNMKMLTIKSTNKFSLITIVNWEKYQNVETESNKQTNTSLTSNQQTTNKRVTTNKNDKKGKNDKKKDIKSKISKKIEEFEDTWKENVEFYKTKYPKRDYKLEKMTMLDWFESNPNKLLKKKNFNLFIQNWLSKAKVIYQTKIEEIKDTSTLDYSGWKNVGSQNE